MSESEPDLRSSAASEPPLPPTVGTEPPLPPQRESLIDALADLLQTASDWVRQEAESTVREKIALPLQNVGIAVGSVAAAGCLAVFGLISIAIALFMVLGQLITYPGAFGLIGVIYVLGAVIFVVISQRKKLKDVAKPTPSDQ